MLDSFLSNFNLPRKATLLISFLIFEALIGVNVHACDAWNSTVGFSMPISKTADGRYWRSIGSGAIIKIDENKNNGRLNLIVATANHVVRSLCQNHNLYDGTCLPTVRFDIKDCQSRSRGSSLQSLHLLWSDSVADVAVVQVSGISGDMKSCLSAINISIASENIDSVVLLGNTQDSKSLRIGQFLSYVNNRNYCNNPHIFSEVIYLNPSIMTKAVTPATPGFSGGPLIDNKDCSLIGIHTGVVYNETTTVHLASPSIYFKYWLAGQPLTPAVAAGILKNLVPQKYDFGWTPEQL